MSVAAITWGVLSGTVIGIATWYVASFIGKPIVGFVDLREKMLFTIQRNQRFIRGAPLRYSTSVVDDGRTKAIEIFEEFGALMRAFEQNQPRACALLALRRIYPARAANAFLLLAMELKARDMIGPTYEVLLRTLGVQADDDSEGDFIL